jgi:hypothetical protein
LADAGGKIRRVAGHFCSFSDVAACPKICEEKVCVELTPFEEELIEVAVGEQSPVQAPPGARVLRVASDRSRAVLRQGIVPSRMGGEPINFFEEINQQSSRLRHRNADSIQIYLLAAVIRSQSDEIALVSDYVIEFVLAEETAKRRV